MPLHTRFRPACEEAFCPHYDTARQNFASKVQWSSWEIISFDSLIVQWREDSKIVEAIADTMFAFRGSSECLRPVGSGGLYLYPQAVTTSLLPIRLPPISLGNLQKVLYNIILTHYII